MASTLRHRIRGEIEPAGRRPHVVVPIHGIDFPATPPRNREQRRRLWPRVARRSFVAVIVLTAAAAVPARMPAVAADEGPYPIWWSPVLELDSLDHVERRLRRLDRWLWREDHPGLEMRIRVDGRRLSAYANSCRSLKNIVAEGFEAAIGREYRVQLSRLAECRAIETLGHAQPARRSFVRNFVLDEDALYSMPAPIDGASCDFVCRQYYAHKKGVSWSAFETMDPIEKLDANTIKVPEYGWARKIQLVGRADVDGDGVEDLMLLIDSWATRGTAASTEFFVLTRHSTDSVLRILNPDQYLCANYSCALGYLMPHLYPDDSVGYDGMIIRPAQVTGDESR
jgi:hypothetical protein